MTRIPTTPESSTSEMSSMANGYHRGMEVNGNGSTSSDGGSRSSSASDGRRLSRRKSTPMMPPFMVSAPGKVIVFGEHAVVHGKAAIAASISLRSYLHVTSLSKSRRTITLRFPDIDLVHSWHIDDLPWALFSHPSKKKYYYDLVTSLDPELLQAIQPHLADVSQHKSPSERKIHQNSAACFLYLFLSLGSQKFHGCIYTLRSTIPIGAGLGSSASIAVCLSAALLLQIRTLSGPHPDQPSEEARLQIERINRWAFVAEMAIHGNPSGVDNTVSTQGKAVVFQRTDYDKPPVVTPLWDFPELPLLLVDTRSPKSTAAEVAKVARLKNTHQKLVGCILDAVDKVTRTAENLIDEDDFNSKEDESLRRMGELMSINHGLLASLGVSHPRLERIRELIDFQGMGWTKLTGAGGGGCSITLMKPDQLNEEGYAQFKTTLGGDGIGVLWPAVLKNGSDEDEDGGMEIDLDKFLKAPGTEGVEKLVGVHGGTGEREGWKFWRPARTPPADDPLPSTAKQHISAQQPPKQPLTIREFEWQRYWTTNPLQKVFEEQGFSSMSPADKRTYLNLELVRTPGAVDRLSKKGQRELWKQLSDANVPLRSAVRPKDNQWGRDKNGRDIGDYTIEEYAAYKRKKSRLANLWRESNFFKSKRERADWEAENQITGEIDTITEDDVKAEKQRRQEMAALRNELYGEKSDPYANDPEWDDVVPIPQAEPENALAAIAYPDDYAEAMAYLRAVMAVKEHTPRCLRLTEHIVDMNPAHYTVWLYRFDIVKALNIPIPDELAWLNDVSLTHLKNYQIWHHRQLLMDLHYPTLQSDESALTALAHDESRFLTEILEKDTKNYHVWSYRQYLVRKLGLWDSPDEMRSIQCMINDDVRNNSAWSHRFFLVFSNPAQSTPDSHAAEHDPKVPAGIIDREISYTEDKIRLAPQNQSPWNYLRGVLVKGGRPLGTVREFAESFVTDLGEGEEKEKVRSSHALDLLADIYKEAGEKEKAALCLRRLGEKWDRIREGYWAYRRRMLES
ncbi:hypothetical protein F5Y19DRAFT_464058 [Xylariaceae sp. FL1651]|nr:hypothetical protein F5Y19DRAFT_464058 [Xylariaceae sp. FL1651]